MRTQRIGRSAAWAVIGTLTLIGLMATAGHYLLQVPPEEAVARGFGPSPAWHLDQRPLYAQHSLLALGHIAPAFLFLLLAPLQLSAHLRARAPGLHRANGRVLVALGLVIALSALALGVLMPFGGRAETAVTVFLTAVFLVALALGVANIRRGRVARHRVWMSRMLAVAYTPVTMRLVLTAGTEGFGLDGQAIFAASMLAGFVVNLIIVETWLRRGTRAGHAAPRAAAAV